MACANRNHYLAVRTGLHQLFQLCTYVCTYINVQFVNSRFEKRPTIPNSATRHCSIPRYEISSLRMLMKTFMVETFNNLYKITVADGHMKTTDLMMNTTNSPIISQT